MLSPVRAPAVAGSFYPNSRADLGALVDRLLDGAHGGHDGAASGPKPRRDGARLQTEEVAPKALVVPHAGYVYSGPIAANAFKLFEPISDRIRRIVLVGPAHRVWVQGLAAPG